MLITKKDVFIKIQSYLTRSLSLAELVDWAEDSMMDAEFAESDYDVIRDVITKIGLADIRHFGLTWDECEGMVNQLGYKIKLDFEYA